MGSTHMHVDSICICTLCVCLVYFQQIFQTLVKILV